MIKVKIINSSRHPLPKYETDQAAAVDLRANIDMPITLKTLDRYVVPTGISMALPVGYEAQIRPRSGLSAKHGITMMNAPGTIDADYRGQIHVIMVNLSHDDFVINDGDRIAQMVLAKHEVVDWDEVEVLDETVRGSGGFGHTGKK